jgi:hypothetical protein
LDHDNVVRMERRKGDGEMNGDDQELARLRAVFTAPAEAAPDPESCPPPEKIWEAVQGELPPSQVREVVEHTALCAACAEDWRLAAELARQERKTAEADRPANVVYGRFRQWRPLAAAAALAAGILLVIGIRSDDTMGPGQEPAYREAPRTELRSLLPEGQALAKRNAVLRWSPLPGATSYDVQVSTEDLRVVATEEGLTSPELRLPESALAGLPSGTRLLWQVQAVFPDGTRETSATFTTTLE